jgi:hypothetical protein
MSKVEGQRSQKYSLARGAPYVFFVPFVVSFLAFVLRVLCDLRGENLFTNTSAMTDGRINFAQNAVILNDRIRVAPVLPDIREPCQFQNISQKLNIGVTFKRSAGAQSMV